MPALYRMTSTAHVLIPSIIYFEDSFDLANLFHSSEILPFHFPISLCLIWSSCNVPKYLYPVVSISFISSSFRSFNLSESFTLPRYIVNTLHLSTTNFILTFWENICTAFIKEFSSLSFGPYSFRSSLNNKWLNFMLRFCSLYLHYRRRTMTKSSGESVSPWKVPLLMFIFRNSWLFAVRIFFHRSLILNRILFTSSANRTSSTASFSHDCGTIS